MKRERCCESCGESLGAVEHSTVDGPLTCGALECERWAAQEDRAERQEAREQAEADHYGRYR